MTTAPVIIGARLRLRPHRVEDMEAFWAFYQSPRAQMMDRPGNRTHLWYGFSSEVGSWDLVGMGGWAIEVDSVLAGQVAVLQPPHFAETEIGWLVFAGFEGQGYAFEAAELALAFTREKIRPASLVSYIDADNHRSIALAKRLGGKLDETAARHAAGDVVYRHAVAQ